MRLRDRATLILASLLCSWASVFADTPSTTVPPSDRIIWKNGELAPPLPQDPAVRAAAFDQLMRDASRRESAGRNVISDVRR
jgi:hypothetical protein